VIPSLVGSAVRALGFRSALTPESDFEVCEIVQVPGREATLDPANAQDVAIDIPQ